MKFLAQPWEPGEWLTYKLWYFRLGMDYGGVCEVGQEGARIKWLLTIQETSEYSK
jgi:hypothetical protein